jgi:hypothetical protein
MVLVNRKVRFTSIVEHETCNFRLRLRAGQIYVNGNITGLSEQKGQRE